MLEKCRILYKGDMMAGSFYLFIGMLLLLFSYILHYYTFSVGFTFLSIGFFMFFFYCIGKGSVIFYISKKRFDFYQNLNALSDPLLSEERVYTAYRLAKKTRNRRRYIYVTVISSIVAFLGIFHAQKGIIMGTAIPISLISAIEFSIGILTEFRLREYNRILNK